MEQEKPADQLAKPRRRWLRTVLLATAIFVCGALVGGGVTFKIIASGYKRTFQEPAVLAEEITHRMKRRLDLTHDQVQQVRRIILEQQMAFQSLRKEFRPRLDDQIEKTRQELAVVLTPEQARKWEKRFARIQRFWLPPLPGDSRDFSPSTKEK
jgi:Spy/CpxP family protein refolding chaperone